MLPNCRLNSIGNRIYYNEGKEIIRNNLAAIRILRKVPCGSFCFSRSEKQKEPQDFLSCSERTAISQIAEFVTRIRKLKSGHLFRIKKGKLVFLLGLQITFQSQIAEREFVYGGVA